MDKNRMVKVQFNRQAQNFSDWSVTQNPRILQYLFDFSKMVQEDNLLDVACGTGAFSIFSGMRIKSVYGVDVSDGMIEIAKKQATANQNIRLYS